MCTAKDWHRIHNSACLLCFLLCVLLNVHVHAEQHQHHVTHRANQSRGYLDLIMLQYGGGGVPTTATMSLAGLQNLMRRIGLSGYADGEDDHDEHEHGHEDGHEHGHEHHEEDSADHGAEVAKVNATAAAATGNETECPSAREMHTWYHKDWQLDLTEAEFQDLCPTLIYLLATGACRAGSHSDGQDEKAAVPDPHHQLKVWGASLLAVTVTSLGGVATIFLIRPLMRTRFYTLVVQFLIALAVGSLSGDAFLHLLPHALFPHGSDSHSHDKASGSGGDSHKHMQTLYRCLTALVGIYCFFVIERVTVLCQNRRSRRRGSDSNRKNNNNNNEENRRPVRKGEIGRRNLRRKETDGDPAIE